MRTHVAAPVPVLEAVSSPIVQSKLSIGAPNDRYEREADRVADQVMRMPGGQGRPSVQRKCAGCSEDEVQREAKDEDEDESVQTKANPGATPVMSGQAQAQISSLGGGRPLSSGERGFFEPRFGHDFSRVQVFDDAKAASAASSIRAHAFTRGHRVVLGSGVSPHTDTGRRLMAHELTHVIQQGQARPKRD